MYESLKNTLNNLVQGETNFIANAANFSALLYRNLKEISWVGFYMITGDGLVLGPFHGKPACVRVEMGKGVCGKAARNRHTVIVDDVHQFPGYIACDPNCNSEIVLPLIFDGKIYGVLDIDSPFRNRFTKADEDNLNELVEILMVSSDLASLEKYYSK
jgi:L-methionine (R)-S-oxide reductase